MFSKEKFHKYLRRFSMIKRFLKIEAIHVHAGFKEPSNANLQEDFKAIEEALKKQKSQKDVRVEVSDKGEFVEAKSFEPNEASSRFNKVSAIDKHGN
jgi:spermidine/putrescine-binding protein